MPLTLNTGIRAATRSRPATSTVFRCVDLFAGAGGFSLAAKHAGLKVIAALELDRHACETYRHNIVQGDMPRLYETDIARFDPKKLMRECFGDGAECDLVLGGPPCQGFSVHRINDAGKGDPRNELIHRYFDFVSALKPRAFLMENVPGILWPRHAPSLKRFYAEAQRAGYNVMPPQQVDARDYGLPQRRKRVFILGLRKDIVEVRDWIPQPTHGSPKRIASGDRLKPWNTCAEVFQQRVFKTDPNDIHMNHSDEMMAVFRKTPPNGGSRRDSGRILPCHQNHNGHKDVYGRIDPRLPGPTMTTACINPSKGRFLHPTKHHGITIRQAARLQTFPDSFEFKGGLMAAGIQIGNAIPVDLGRILLLRVLEILRGAR